VTTTEDRRPPVEVPHRALIEEALRFSKAMQHWAEAGAQGMAYPRLRVLELLYCDGPARMRDLADAAGLRPRNLTSVADALEAEGMVRRVPHPVDRRATLLELTPAGGAEIEAAFGDRMAALASVFGVLDEADRTVLTAALGTLADGVEGLLRPGACGGDGPGATTA
jgi:DNA-binding MarR family transcriptional regulator